MSEESESVSETEARTKCPCPIGRADIVENFSDGQWWTISGMADALGPKLADEMAMRFYLHWQKHAPPGSIASQVVRARRSCVQRVVAGMARDKVCESEIRNGERAYRFAPPTATKHVKLALLGSVDAPKKPEATATGLTRAGVAAIIRDHGGKIGFDELLKLVDGLFAPNIVERYLAALGRPGNRKRGSMKPRSQKEIVAAAKSTTLSEVLRDLRQAGVLTMTKVIQIELTSKPSAPSAKK